MHVRKVPMSRIREQYKKLKIDRKWLILVLLTWIASMVLKINIFPVLFLGLFCIANAILLSIDRYVSAPVDLEFSTFSAVLMTIKYDVKWGILAAVLTKLAAIVYNKNIRVDHIFMIGGYVIAALFANILRSMPIIMLGVLITVIVNIYTLFVSNFITMLSKYEIVMYGISNTIFNIVLFIGFSQFFMTIMGILR